MNRKERRAAEKRDSVSPTPMRGGPPQHSVAEMMIAARSLYHQGRQAEARALCETIVLREPGHVHALNLLGLMAQGGGRHRLAVKLFSAAVASDPLNAACHFNLAASYKALEQDEKAAAHYKQCIAFGMSDKSFDDIFLQNPVIAACVDRIGKNWPLPTPDEDMPELGMLADDIFLQCVLGSTVIGGLEYEVLLTHVRGALLRLAIATVRGKQAVDGKMLRLFSALAQQCFITEYVYELRREEAEQAAGLRDWLLDRLAAGGDIPPITLVAVAAYFPLHRLPQAEALLARAWPDSVAELVHQMLREPLEETRDRASIPKLTPIEDSVSLQVQHQYEENPYPRWTVSPNAVLAAERKLAEIVEESRHPIDMLIAGCGTGRHASMMALTYPESRILAIDISATSLAYARRKTREEGLSNIEYAQADILQLGGIGRTFDEIEVVGVLHHLDDPLAGWRVLLSMLRPLGKMRVGLYSEKARSAVVEARALIASRGYTATAEDIRRCRQEILRDNSGRYRSLTGASDFFSMSGCRDLIFNVMEHRFTLPQIEQFLGENGLEFLGFELPAAIMGEFRRRYPGEAALTDLKLWDAFEAARPDAFWNMYVFSVRRRAVP